MRNLLMCSNKKSFVDALCLFLVGCSVYMIRLKSIYFLFFYYTFLLGILIRSIDKKMPMRLVGMGSPPFISLYLFGTFNLSDAIDAVELCPLHMIYDGPQVGILTTALNIRKIHH